MIGNKVQVDNTGLLVKECPKCSRKTRRIEELVPEIRKLTERGIHATMLSVVQTISNQRRNHPHLPENQIYWDAINLTFTLDMMTEHFLEKLDEAIEPGTDIDTILGKNYEK